MSRYLLNGRQFVNALRGIAIEIDGAVIVNAHPSLSGIDSGSGTSGSTAWSNSVRSRLYLTSEKNAKDRRVLSTMKSNYSGLSDDIELEWRDGVLVTDKEQGGVTRVHMDEQDFLQSLDDRTEQGRASSPSLNSSDYAPKVIAKATGSNKARMEQAMERLFGLGTIKVVEIGSTSKRKKVISRA